MTDFEFYIDEYGGCSLQDEEEFERMAKKARRFIENVTYTEPDFEDDDVKACVCALAEIYAENSSVTSIVREKIGDFEAEYRDDAEEKVLMHTVTLYIPPVLLCKGF